jgi:hypothetical protein
MRLWSIHPKYLDAAGLVALWREGLLAKKVLLGKTKGYKEHPQLARFKRSSNPGSVIDLYLKVVYKEAQARGYNFDSTKIGEGSFEENITVNIGQFEYEWKHLLAKLEKRSPELFRKYSTITLPEPHPLFEIIRGGIEDWEKI